MMTDLETAKFCQNVRPAVVGHRGAPHRYPENSLASFKEAINIAMQNPDVRFYMEMDLRPSSDGAIMIMHESDVSYTTRGHGNIENMTKAEIQLLPLKTMREDKNVDFIIDPSISQASGVGAPLDPNKQGRSVNGFYKITDADFKVPTLTEVIAITREANKLRSKIGTPIGLALEIKAAPPINDIPHYSEFILGHLAFGMRRIGFNGIASKLIDPNPVLPALNDVLLDSVKHHDDMPIVIFSAIGPIGQIDPKQAWASLSHEVKLHLMHVNTGQVNFDNLTTHDMRAAEKLNAPQRLEFIDSSALNTTVEMWRQAVNHSRKFWAMGSLAPQTALAAATNREGFKIYTTLFPTNRPEDINFALTNGANMITSNYPDLVIHQIHNYQKLLPAQPAADAENISNFAQQETIRRQQQAALDYSPKP